MVFRQAFRYGLWEDYGRVGSSTVECHKQNFIDGSRKGLEDQRVIKSQNLGLISLFYMELQGIQKSKKKKKKQKRELIHLNLKICTCDIHWRWFPLSQNQSISITSVARARAILDCWQAAIAIVLLWAHDCNGCVVARRWHYSLHPIRIPTFSFIKFVLWQFHKCI